MEKMNKEDIEQLLQPDSAIVTKLACRFAENKSSAAKAASNNTNEDLFLCLNETLLEAMKEITSIESLKLPKSADISDMADAIKDKINQRATKLGIPTSQNNDNTSIASETATNK